MNKNNFIAEILASGGPRHGKSEELCEDAAGLVFFDKGVAFYLADGTSDNATAGAFSSRYLANSLGYYFLEEVLNKHITDEEKTTNEPILFPPPSPLIKKIMEEGVEANEGENKTIDVQTLFHKSLKKLSSAWKKEFNACMGNATKGKEICDALEPFKAKETTGFYTTFSTTFCGGVLFHKDRSLHLVKIGDSDAIIAEKGKEVERLRSHRERYFARINANADKTKVEILFQEADFKKRSYNNIDFMVVKSDGLRFTHDELTINLLKETSNESFLKFRKILLKGCDNNVGDDKSLLYLKYR
ncbi:MAG: protein phosphatase 2C domain-containing protein [Nitrospinae bacterium]|nr:protein phosphatase 2C domain-containing protein [Nitrospinota bacterium]